MKKKKSTLNRPIRQKQGTYERIMNNKKKYNRKRDKII